MMAKVWSRVVVMFLCMVVWSHTSQAQEPTEKAPYNYINYELDLSGIKTPEKAQAIEDELKNLQGIEKCELVFLEYHLSIISKNGTVTPEQIKAILSANGVQIKTFEQKMIR